jgi:hypothetical protein
MAGDAFLGVVAFVVVGCIIILPWIFYVLTLVRALTLTTEYHSISPKQAWLILIPIFGLGWQFYIIHNLTKGIKGKCGQMAIECGGAGKAIGMTFAILLSCNLVIFQALGSFAPASESFHLFLPLLMAIPTLITWIWYWVKIIYYNKLLRKTRKTTVTS